MGRKNASDLALAALADAQHGVIARRQLIRIGVTEGAITLRLGHRLRPLYRGVYAVGHTALRLEGRWMAAILASGDDAVLSHASAAAAWELRPVGSGAIHVTVPGDTGRTRRSGIRVHRSVTLQPRDTATVRGIPITAPVRTVVDLAATLEGRPLEQALDRAELLGLVDFGELRRAARPARPGAPALRAVLLAYTGATLTRSELEEAFLGLCDDHGIERPEANARIEGFTVDFAWRDRCLIVEVDGYAHHRSPTAFEDDRERDVMLTLAGWRVLRFTWRQVKTRAAWVATAVR